MAGKNRRQRPKAQKKTSKTRSRSRTRIPRTSTTPLSGLIARGIRTLISVLPGSTLLKGVADFIFSAYGYTPAVLPDKDGKVQAKMQLTGLCAMFHVALKDILYDSSTHGVRNLNGGWTTNYGSGVLKSVTITVIPDSAQGEKRGSMAIGFIPFRTKSEANYYNDKPKPMSYEQLKDLPGSKSCPVGIGTLTITFTVRPADGRLTTDMMLDEEIGAVFICFDNTSRTSYGNFTPEEFSATVLVSGVIRLCRPQEIPLPFVYGRRLDDKMGGMTLLMTPSRDRFIVSDSSLESTSTHVIVRGQLSMEDYERALDAVSRSMILE